MPVNGKPIRRNSLLAVLAIAVAPLWLAGCEPFKDFTKPANPAADRAERVGEALRVASERERVSGSLTPAAAVSYALRNNFDLKVANIELAYREEEQRGARMRMLPRLQAQVDLSTRNHPDASSSTNARTGAQYLQQSYSTDRTTYPAEISLVWNLLDFGAGYLRSRQAGEKLLHSREQIRRLRQQTAFEVLSAYWRMAAAAENAREAEILIASMREQIDYIHESRSRGVLAAAEASRRELALLGGMVEAEHWLRIRDSSRIELARAMGCLDADLEVAAMESDGGLFGDLAGEPLPALQQAALYKRPELYQADSQERISLDEAKLALLQMAPNANLSLALNHNNDSHLMWSDWATAGIRVTWNLLAIPARLSERRSALLQKEAAREKGMAVAAAIVLQVAMARSEWSHARAQMERVTGRAEVRGALVESLAEAEKEGQTRPGEVLHERVRLLDERGFARMKGAEERIALARLASAVGYDLNDNGEYVR